ncbi:MAG: glutathione synthase [Pseudomonadota bacterium]
MSLRIAVLVETSEIGSPQTDTTFAMLEEAQRRDMPISVFSSRDLVYDSGDVFALLRSASVDRSSPEPIFLGTSKWANLKTDADIVLVRKDPPFNMSYITSTYILEMIIPETKVINDPRGVRSSPEKILPTLFHDLQPPTVILKNKDHLREFWNKHQDIVIKPLYGYGGQSVLRLREGDQNFDAILEMFDELSSQPVIGQAFLPRVSEGDKRIILVGGRPVGAINRKPRAGSIRSNLAVGGVAEATELTPAEVEICDRIGPELVKRGLQFVGIDVISGQLTEINVTSPTGAQQIRELSGLDPVARFFDLLEGVL